MSPRTDVQNHHAIKSTEECDDLNHATANSCYSALSITQGRWPFFRWHKLHNISCSNNSVSCLLILAVSKQHLTSCRNMTASLCSMNPLFTVWESKIMSPTMTSKTNYWSSINAIFHEPYVSLTFPLLFIKSLTLSCPFSDSLIFPVRQVVNPITSHVSFDSLKMTVVWYVT